MRIRLVGLSAAVLVTLSIAVPAHAETIEEWGYLTVRDGTRLRYHVMYPAEPAGGRFPVLLQHEGYDSGTNAQTWPMNLYASDLMMRGYALLGVSVRGTGCSQGEFDPFETQEALDAHDVIEWAGTVPAWSDGRVGMIGLSFGGIMQLLGAQEQPPHLQAIVPSSPLADFYRDVFFPGGILNSLFPTVWTPSQKQWGTTALATTAGPEGDAECLANYAAHEAANTNHLTPKMLLDAPFEDDAQATGESLFRRSPFHGFPRISVPTFLFGTWQDEQLPARWSEYLSLFGNQDRLWVNLTNGFHGRDYLSPRARALTLDFLDRFVRGVNNGFEERVPPISLAMESTYERGGVPYDSAWSIGLPIDFHATPRDLFLDRRGTLSETPPATGASDRLAYPMPAADVAELGLAMTDLNDLSGRSDNQTSQATWKVPVAPGGALAYTSQPLEQDMVLFGPASLDVWLTSTATDTDVQVTITELRPDGMETYVQRGWLRASHRKLDPELSTRTRPYHTHARTDAAPLAPGEPELLRVEVFPFAHAFREGSRLRVWIDAPTSRTGLWGFAYHPEPAINTIYYGAGYSSKLVVGVIERQAAEGPLPACDTLVNQPCRLDPLGVG